VPCLKAAGFDSSGNLKYIGIVIGEKYKLWKLLNVLERSYSFTGSVHLRELWSSTLRVRVANKILESKHEFICLYIDFEWILGEIWREFPRYPKKGIRKHLGEAIWPYIRGVLYRHDVSRVYICRDVEWIFKNRIDYRIGGLSCLADTVAWVNLRKPEDVNISRVRELRLREKLKKTVISRLRERA